jgi:outer membrane protein assembly factor BamB
VAGALGVLVAVLGGSSAEAQVPCLPPVCTPTTSTSAPPPTTPTTAPPPSGPIGETAGAVTSRIDAARTGYLPGDVLVPPLVPIWVRHLSGPVISRPLIAAGRVFLTTAPSDDGHKWLTRALDARTGRVLWSRSLGDGVGLGYDNGLLVTSGYYNGSAGVDAATGAPRWSGIGVGSDPTVTGGGVYGHGIALDAANGQMIWGTNPAGETGPPAVSSDTVFLAGSTCQAVALDRSSGAARWSQPGECSGDYRAPAALAPQRVLTLAGATLRIREADTGRELAARPAMADPVVSGDAMYVLGRDSAGHVSLAGLHSADGSEAWHRALPHWSPGYDTAVDLVGAGRWLFVQSGATIAVRSADDGGQSWTVPIFKSALDGQNPSTAGYAPGIVVTAGGREVVAWAPLFRPAAHAVQALPEGPIRFGQRARILGRTGTALAGTLVRVLAGARVLGSTHSHADGFVERRVRIRRNTKLRVEAGGAHSRAFSVFVYPQVRLKQLKVTPRHATLRVTFRGPRGVRLAGRHVELYLGSPQRRRYLKLGGGVLHARGPGRARARVRIPSQLTTYNDDFIVACAHGQARAGLGDPADPLLRLCGKHAIRLR